MSIVSNDFGQALAQVRNAISSMSAEMQSMRAELDHLRREVAVAREASVDNFDTTVMRAAARGDQVQLEALSHQSLTPKQAEIIRLALQPSEELSHQVTLDPEMIARFQEARRLQKHRPTVSVPQAPVNDRAQRMNELSIQLTKNAHSATQDQQMQRQVQKRMQAIANQQYKRNNNAIGTIRRFDSLDSGDF